MTEEIGEKWETELKGMVWYNKLSEEEKVGLKRFFIVLRLPEALTQRDQQLIEAIEVRKEKEQYIIDNLAENGSHDMAFANGRYAALNDIINYIKSV